MKETGEAMESLGRGKEERGMKDKRQFEEDRGVNKQKWKAVVKVGKNMLWAFSSKISLAFWLRTILDQWLEQKSIWSSLRNALKDVEEIEDR